MDRQIFKTYSFCCYLPWWNNGCDLTAVEAFRLIIGIMLCFAARVVLHEKGEKAFEEFVFQHAADSSRKKGMEAVQEASVVGSSTEENYQ